MAAFAAMILNFCRVTRGVKGPPNEVRQSLYFVAVCRVINEVKGPPNEVRQSLYFVAACRVIHEVKGLVD
jgi:hypothetical protein